MRLTSFTFDKELVRSFIDFGYEHYRRDARWIPPFRQEIEHQLSPEYFFYTKAGNRHRHFLALDGARATGRVTAAINSDLKDKDGRAVGTLGFFECSDDYGVAEQLLRAATDWLHDSGAGSIWGPMNFDIWHSYRFMTRGFGEERFFGEPYNKEYYPEMFERFGFTVKAEWDSVEITGRETLAQMIERGASRYRLLLERGYRFEQADLTNLEPEIDRLRRIMSRSFEGFLGFTPISNAQLAYLLRKALPAIHPRMFLFCYNAQGELVGFSLALVELADAIRAMNGSTGTLARLKFLHHRRRANKINFYIGGVTPEEAKSRSGLGRAGFYYIINEMLNAGYETLLLTLRLKGNLAHALPARHSPEPQREYALYELRP